MHFCDMYYKVYFLRLTIYTVSQHLIMVVNKLYTKITILMCGLLRYL
jgi:hypothetical protein